MVMPRPQVLALLPWALGREDPLRRRATVFCETLAAANDVTVISLVPSSAAPSETVRSEGVREIQVPLSAAFDALRAEAVGRSGLAAELAVLPSAPGLTPGFAAAVRRLRPGATHVLTVPALASAAAVGSGPTPMLLADRSDYLAARALVTGETTNRLLHDIAGRERAALRSASAVIVPAARDVELLTALYGSLRTNISGPANAFAGDSVRCILGEERALRKAQSNLAGRSVAVAFAPAEAADAAAIQRLVGIARQLPDVLILVLGSLPGVPPESLPANVQCTGEASGDMVDQILACADLAVDTAADGESNGVRALDYARRGISVVGTPASVRLLPPDAALRAEIGVLHVGIQMTLDDPGAALARARAAALATGSALDKVRSCRS